MQEQLPQSKLLDELSSPPAVVGANKKVIFQNFWRTKVKNPNFL